MDAAGHPLGGDLDLHNSLIECLDWRAVGRQVDLRDRAAKRMGVAGRGGAAGETAAAIDRLTAEQQHIRVVDRDADAALGERLPCPLADSTPSRPFILSTPFFAIANPMPVPS